MGAGSCTVCGHIGDYVRTEAPTRENHECASCRASLRYRQQAATITATYGTPGQSLTDLLHDPLFRELAIFEPGIIGPFRRLLRGLAHYVNSYFWDDVAPGTQREGVRCEDLRSLTLPAASQDLVISSDIFEHVRGPMLAFAELYRVLKPGGHHIFTVPLRWPFPGTTLARVDYSGAEDVLLAPAEYHGSPVDPRGSLVYTDFGMDLPEQLRELGFDTVTHHGYRNAITFVARKPASPRAGDTG
jgi:SAM-dependent methyltransferase